MINKGFQTSGHESRWPDLVRYDTSSLVASICPSSKAPDTVLIQKESSSERAVVDTRFRGQLIDENSHGPVQDIRHDSNAYAVEHSKEANLEFHRTSVDGVCLGMRSTTDSEQVRTIKQGYLPKRSSCLRGEC
ncbi:hypothetical protein Droror1_Dr00027804 [Drosera rotundifolia]